jgi:uncharacterized protein YoxC
MEVRTMCNGTNGDTEGDQTPSREHLSERIDHLTAQFEALEAENEALREKNQTLRDALEDKYRELADLHEELETLRDRLEECERRTTRLDAATDAAHKRSGANKERIEELQARELEKGAHLLEENVDRHEIDVTVDRLEKLTKDDGRPYYRLPEHDDPLERGGSIALAHGDLLPIQQLARMDEEMLRSTTNALPTRLAARLWKARADSSVGDNPWNQGCKGIREYVKASDLKHWIRRQEPGTSDTYAKKLVSRTIDALLDLSKNRLAVRKKQERKNGLSYTERRLILPADVEIPGERSHQPEPPEPETADVPG